MPPNKPAVGDPQIKKSEPVAEVNEVLKTGEVLIHLSDPDADSDAAISLHGGDLPEALRERNPETRHQPENGAEIADLLGGPMGEQVIHHALGVHTDAGAVNNFSPARLAETTLPADPRDGRPGLPTRLRITEVVNQAFAEKFAGRGGTPELDVLLAQAAGEKGRLAQWQGEVRRALRVQLAAEIERIEQRVADLRADNMPDAVISADHDRRKLHDLKFHLKRITGLLEPPAARPPTPTQPPAIAEGSNP